MVVVRPPAPRQLDREESSVACRVPHRTAPGSVARGHMDGLPTCRVSFLSFFLAGAGAGSGLPAPDKQRPTRLMRSAMSEALPRHQLAR